MTREEHIYQLKQYLQYKSVSMCPSSSLYWQEHWEEVIKVLEQEPILEKIREEIKVMTSNRGFLSCSVDYIHEKIDAVFDKYKAESEE